jgi:hypothetical protein
MLTSNLYGVRGGLHDGRDNFNIQFSMNGQVFIDGIPALPDVSYLPEGNHI